MPDGEASAAPSPDSTPDQDVLWLFGTEIGKDGYQAQLIGPDASLIGTLSSLPYPVARTTDGKLVIVAIGSIGKPTVLRVFAARSGEVVQSISGTTAWPNEPELVIAVGSSAGPALVTGTAYEGVPTGKYATKMSRQGDTREVPLLEWRATRVVETYDLYSGQGSSSSGPVQVAVGTRSIPIRLNNSSLVLETGPSDARVFAAVGADLASGATVELSGTPTLLATDDAGRAYLITEDRLVAVVSPTGVQRTIDVGLAGLTKLTAKPYLPTVLSTGDGSIVIVDVSRRIIARVNVASGAIEAQRELSTSQVIAPGVRLPSAAAAVDAARRRIYVLDGSQIAGGVWVHDADSLAVLDRWHSDMAFQLVWAAPSSGAVYLQTVDGPVAVHSNSGEIIGFVPSALHTTRAL